MRKKTVHILSKIFCIAGMMLFCIIAIKSTVYAAKGDVKINKKNFPNAVFRENVSYYYDKNKNGILSKKELQSVKKMDLYLGDPNNVQSIKGIEYFSNLASLDLSDNCLESLDVTKNKKLEELSVNDNYNLKELNISGNKKLKKLNCYNTSVQLDLSKNTQLETLYCYGSHLKALDVSKNSKLKILDCSDNDLTELNINKIGRASCRERV